MVIIAALACTNLHVCEERVNLVYTVMPVDPGGSAHLQWVIWDAVWARSSLSRDSRYDK